LFVNQLDCSYLEVVPREDAIKHIEQQQPTKLNVKSLLVQGNGILRQHPNYLFINPGIVVLADGATSITSKDAGKALKWQVAWRTS
jgi:hypothetical protein